VLLLEEIVSLCNGREYPIGNVDFVGISACEHFVGMQRYDVLAMDLPYLIGFHHFVHCDSLPAAVGPKDVRQRAEEHTNMVFDRLSFPVCQLVVQLH